MTTARPRPISLPTRRRASLPVVLTVLLLSGPAAAQPTATPPPAAAERKEAEPKTDLPDRFDRGRFMPPSADHFTLARPFPTEPTVWFFPPVPPPLGTEYLPFGPQGSRPPAPPELSAYVDELFYPALGTHLYEDDLPKTRQAELKAYRAAKSALQNELRARVAAVKDAKPADRARQLAAFAAEQTPRIVALEATAEKLRTDLQPTDLFGSPLARRDPRENPGWRLRAEGDGPARPEDLWSESESLRGLAFSREGLSTAQRRLLLEAAVALKTAARAASDAGPALTEGWVLPFSPEPARIRLLANLPAPLAKQIGEYVAARQALTTELCETLRRASAIGESALTETLKRLAVEHAPRIAALETAAEEIRGALAELPAPPGPPAPPALPAELMSRIATYREHKLAVLKTLYAMLADPLPARRENDPGTAGEDPASAVRTGASPVVVRPVNLRVSVEEFNRQQNTLIGELNAERTALREALSEYGRATNQPADRKSIDDLLKDFEKARQQQEIWDRYRDYQTAVLLPGLSPEQRRLLFSAAVEQLALPLPAGVWRR